jgi:radical SAM family uncharacterized protein
VKPSELRSKVLDDVLSGVETPGQYVGCEVNSVVKPQADCRVALCFPDLYSVGMSHLGLKILYETLNAREGVAAERCFAPQPDMERELRSRGLPLYGLESFTPLGDFDLVGFSLQYELTYSNVLTILDLAGIPLHAAERGEGVPLVIAGGPNAYNPEPLADFVDLFLVGEAEESLPELVEMVRAAKGHSSRRELLLECARKLPGAYVPALYDVSYAGDGRVESVTPNVEGAPERVARRLASDLDSAPAPVRPVVPFVECVHDRLTVEIMRGCAHGCRFCQAGTTYRPLRRRSVERVLEIVEQGLASTGYDEVGLLSLSSSDYPQLVELVGKLNARHGKSGVSISLPSLRVNAGLAGIPELVSAVRKGAITVAPEAGTERLRRAINKPVGDEQLFDGLAAAFRAGWNRVKLYFMAGLPTETDEDLAAVAGIIERSSAMARKLARRAGRVNASVSNFVPKPGTPFQWEAMCSAEEFTRRHELVRAAIMSRRGFRLKFHDVPQSMLEGALARGDRRLGAVVEHAWRAGARLDGWSEHFRADLWEEAFRAEQLSPAFYAERERDLDEVLPWDHISQGVRKSFLAAERQRALAGEVTPECPSEPGAENCAGCGACPAVDC